MLGTITSYHHFPPEISTTTYYDHFDPRKYQLIAALCLSEWLIQNERFKTTSWLVIYAALWESGLIVKIYF